MKKTNWKDKIPKEILDKMIQEKLGQYYERPSFKETFAENIMTIAKRSLCLFYNVGAIIFRNNHMLSSGYNGPAAGDCHCTDVGCARIVDGQIKKGTGLCRGTHAELNAISNAASNGVNITGASMIVTYKPCFTCAKQIANAKIKEVFYLFDYDGENTEDYLRKLHINIFKYDI